MNNEMKITPADSKYIRLVQITDTHISTETGEQFENFDTRESLGRVIKAINAFETAPDAVLLTGDLVHEAGEIVYRKLLEQLTLIKAPVICLPGNHDDPVLMNKVLNAQNVSTDKVLSLDQWTVILLNTWIPDSHSGRLSEQELEFLDTTLAGNADKFILVCMHHPPVKIGSPWMDAMMLENPQSLFDIIDANPRVRGVIWGHIHQEFYIERNGMKLLGTPSTCVQFKPDTERFAKDVLPPAFRLLSLQRDGGMESKIFWVKGRDIS